MRHNTLGRYLVIATVLALFGCNKSANPPDTSTSSGGTTSGENAAPNATPNAAPNAAPTENSPAPKPSAPLFAPKPIIVDAGTEITVTADQAVSSKTNNAGDRFDASLAEPVVVGEKVVIPKGAKAIGTVTDAKSAGKFKGNAAITVTLSSITVAGKEYQVATSAVTEAGKGRGKRTAVGAGGGAVVGALIGGLAGGGKGAAIGAGAGAGAGTAGAALTGERDITIPAETKLHFKLKDPLEIRKK
jgi:hypothetical protein